MAGMRIENPFARFMNEHDERAVTLPTMGFTIDTPVDGRLLERAVGKAVEVYPLMGMSLEAQNGGSLFVPNGMPLVITNGPMPVRPGTEAANGHVFTTSYMGCDMAFSVLHSVTDGGGFLLFLKTVLYSYFCMRDGREYEPGTVRTGGEPKETFGCYFDMDYDDVAPRERYPDSFAPREFALREGEGVLRARVAVSSGAFLEKARAIGTSPSVLIFLIFARAVYAMHPEHDGDVAITMTMDARKAFGMPWATMNTSTYSYLYAKRAELSDDAIAGTAERLRAELKEALKEEDMRRTAGDVVLHGRGDSVLTTAKMAYLGRFELGGATDYVRDVRFAEDSVHKFDIVDVGGRLCIDLMFGGATDVVAAALEREFARIGMEVVREEAYAILPNGRSRLSKLGYSDRYFYYRSGETSDFDCRITMTFSHEADLDVLQRAADGALRCVPGFAVRPVLYDGSVYYEPDDRPVAIFPDDGATRYFGTDEMNGYLFCLLVKGREVTLSYFHGLTDFAGVMDYVKSLVFLYARDGGRAAREKNLEGAVAAGLLSQPSEDCVHDPYGFFADGKVPPTWHFDGEKILCLPRGGGAKKWERGMRISFPVASVLSATRELSTSFLPYLVDLVAGVISGIHGTGDGGIVARSTADLRRVFDIRTLENFSDSLLLPCMGETDGDAAERCAFLKAQMRQQLTKENYRRTFARKAAAVDVAENEREDNPYGDVSGRKVTFSLIYTGNMTLPDACDGVVENFRLEMGADFDEGLFIVCHTFGESVDLDILEKDGRFPVANAICRTLAERHLNPTTEKIYAHGCNLMSRSLLKRMVLW